MHAPQITLELAGETLRERLTIWPRDDHPLGVDAIWRVQISFELIYTATQRAVGVPALLCLGMYFWLSLSHDRKSQISDFKSQNWELAWLKTTCRASAIVLLVGFWFDGGLFKLPTAATFWILLELGREEERVC